MCTTANVNEYSFIADAMLGKIARKLRMFGYDTLYESNTKDDYFIFSEVHTNRIILTSDKELFNRCRKKGFNIILLNKKTEFENLVTIFLSLKVKFIDPNISFSRCTICNGLLGIVDNDNIFFDANQKIPKLNNIKEIYQCKICKKIYWKGSHVNNILNLIKKMNIELSSQKSTGTNLFK